MTTRNRKFLKPISPYGLTVKYPVRDYLSPVGRPVNMPSSTGNGRDSIVENGTIEVKDGQPSVPPETENGLTEDVPQKPMVDSPQQLLAVTKVTAGFKTTGWAEY